MSILAGACAKGGVLGGVLGIFLRRPQHLLQDSLNVWMTQLDNRSNTTVVIDSIDPLHGVLQRI